MLNSSDDRPPTASDRVVGWSFHYLVGIAYALLLFLIWGHAFAVHPTLWPTVVIGLLLSTFAGLFIFLPALGAGLAGARLPDQTATIARMIAGHVVFMLAQYFTALCLAATL